MTQITGLDPSALADAPLFSDIAPALAKFIGDSTIVGQSVGFDLRFLTRRGLVPNAIGLDTYDLATIVLPAERRYGLGHLCRLPGVPLADAPTAPCQTPTLTASSSSA